MRNDRALAAVFGAAALACAAGAMLLRGHGASFIAAVIAAVLMGLNALAVWLKYRYTDTEKIRISAVTVSKAPFEHEPSVRGKSPPPGQ